MKSAPFDYHRPGSVDEAVALLAELDDARILAGGQSLVPMLGLRLAYVDHLIDVSGLAELATLERQGAELRIGGAVTQAVAGRDAIVAAGVPLLATAIPSVGHGPLRNRGTVVGSIAHADPAAEIPAVLVALDGAVEAVSVRGRRTIAAADFFQGTWWTALEDDEMAVAATFPVWSGRVGAAVEEVTRRHGDFAIAGAAVQVALDDEGVVTRCGIGLFGLGSTPLRATAADAAVVGVRGVEVDAETVGALAVDGLDDPPEDASATSEQRRRLGAVTVARALRAAIEGVGHG